MADDDPSVKKGRHLRVVKPPKVVNFPGSPRDAAAALTELARIVEEGKPRDVIAIVVDEEGNFLIWQSHSDRHHVAGVMMDAMGFVLSGDGS